MNLRKITISVSLSLCTIALTAQQQILSLENCRSLALQENKKILIAQQQVTVEHHNRKAAFTDYLPKISMQGIYLHNQKNISLLDNRKKEIINNIGSLIQQQGAEVLKPLATSFPELSNLLNTIASSNIAEPLNTLGHSLTDALTLETRNIYIAALTLKQPIFMGGKITAYNKITQYSEEIAHAGNDIAHRETLLAVDQAYWLVISLVNKQRLANALVTFVTQLRDDVEKMKKEGMATESELLNVNVRLNEVQMALLEVENGVTLARMQLCMLCGLPMESNPTLADETLSTVPLPPLPTIEGDINNRPELRSLESAIEIRKQITNMARAELMPQLSLAANYIASSPNLTNGFSKKMRGMWNIALQLNIPIWNWGEDIHKVKAAKAETVIARYTLEDARQKIELQARQARQKMNEAYKRLTLATNSIREAEENLRSAKLSFGEGIATSENVLEAQTGWLKAHSAQIDAHIDAIMAHTYLQWALGTLK